MKYKHIKGNEIDGHLDICISHQEEEFKGEIEKWDEVLIHGDPKGLRSLARLLIEIADLNQEQVEDRYLPVGAREHYHLTRDIDLSNTSVSQVTVGRLDAKGTGEFYEKYTPKK
jgi:bisphosphoglycerate-dependent phosphoglycerate mutase